MATNDKNLRFGKLILGALLGVVFCLGYIVAADAAFPTDPVATSARNLGAASSGDVKFGLQYTPGSNITYCLISVQLQRAGSPSDYVRLEIRHAPSPNFDSGSAVAVDVLGSTIPTTSGGTWIDFNIPGCYAMTGGQVYTFVVSRTGAVDGTNYYVHFENGALNPTPDLYRIYTSGSWTSNLTSRTPGLKATSGLGSATVTMIPLSPQTFAVTDVSAFNLIAAKSSVDYTANPGLTGHWEFSILDGATTLWSDTNAPLVTATCPDGNYCGGESVTIAWLPSVLTYKARVCFTGYSCTAYATNTYTLVGSFGGGSSGGGTGSVGGTTSTDINSIATLWGGGVVDWNTFLTGYPPFAGCTDLGVSPTSWLQCVAKWLGYIVFPQNLNGKRLTYVSIASGGFLLNATCVQATSGASGTLSVITPFDVDLTDVTGTFDTSHLLTCTNPDSTTGTIYPTVVSDIPNLLSNTVSTPLGVLFTRWPLSYITLPVQAFQDGLATGSNVCPIPTIFPTTFTLLGHSTSLPSTWTLCTAFTNVNAAAAIYLKPPGLGCSLRPREPFRCCRRR